MKKILLSLSGLVLLSCLAGLLLFSSLPWLVNRYLPSQLAEHSLEFLKLTVDRTTPWTTVLRLEAGAQEEPAIDLPRVEIHYTPRLIRQGKISTVTLSGARILLDAVDGSLRLPGIEPAPGQSDATPSAALLPVLADHIFLENCQIVLRRTPLPPLSIVIDGTLELKGEQAADGGFLLVSLQASLRSSGGLAAQLQVQLDSEQGGMTARITGKLPVLTALAHLLPTGVSIMGSAEVAATLRLTSDLTGYEDIDASLAVNDSKLFLPGRSIETAPGTTIELTLGGNAEQLHWHLAGLSITAPTQLAATLAGTFTPESAEFRGKGELQPVLMKEAVTVDFDGAFTNGIPRLTFSATGGSLTLPQAEITTGPYRLSGKLEPDLEGSTIDARLEIDTLAAATHDLKLRGLSSNLRFPLNGGDGGGRASIDQILYAGEDLATTELTFDLAGASGFATATGSLTTRMSTPLKLDYSAKYGEDAGLTAVVSLARSTIDHNGLPRFLAVPEGLTFTAALEAQGNYAIGPEGLRGNLSAKVSDGSVAMEESNLLLSGIATELHLPHLPALVSAPSQLLTIDNLTLGSIQMSRARISYRLEEDSSLFLEKARLDWCNGKVESGSARISPKTKRYETTLYCDRLQFSELLRQFGISRTEGDGSLNGRLPVNFSEKGFFFDDGFLFSTPGNSGIVRFSNTAMLKESLPEMGEAAYLDYSIQALEDFSYNWAKLTFNTIEDDLVVSMQIDGKPANPLPYGYKGGQLVKRAEGNGIQHPLRLDVNFHLPFAEMFSYSKNFQKLMENMK